LRPCVFVSAKTGFGMRALRDRIKIEAKRIERDRVHVGIIGYPNTGKSSLINLLARKAAASVSKKAGHTKGIQKIRLVKGILLLDSPGVIPVEKYSTVENVAGKDAILGAKTFSDVKNPEDVVYKILEKNPDAIEKFYGIKDENFNELIEKIGKKKNFLKKKGEVDVDRTARVILKDWQEGRIKSG